MAEPLYEAVADRYDVFESAESTVSQIEWDRGHPDPKVLREAAMWLLLLAFQIEGLGSK